MQVIDIEKFDKQMEKEKTTQKAKEKLKSLETSNEAKRNLKDKIITDPFANIKKVDKVKEEQSHIKGALEIDKILMDIESKKVKNDRLISKLETQNINSIEEELDAFEKTPIGQSANEHINNIITMIYEEPIKKKILKANLESNPIIRRNNHRVVYNIVNKLPLIVQYPIFVGLEVIKTEDQIKNIQLFQRQQQLLREQQQQQQEKKEEKKEEEKKE